MNGLQETQQQLFADAPAQQLKVIVKMLLPSREADRTPKKISRALPNRQIQFRLKLTFCKGTLVGKEKGK
jgi:hypothetical protein